MDLQAVGHGFLSLAQKLRIFLDELLHGRAVDHHDELEGFHLAQGRETGLGRDIQGGNLVALEHGFLLVVGGLAEGQLEDFGVIGVHMDDQIVFHDILLEPGICPLLRVRLQRRRKAEHRPSRKKGACEKNLITQAFCQCFFRPSGPEKAAAQGSAAPLSPAAVSCPPAAEKGALPACISRQKMREASPSPPFGKA